MSIFSHYDYQDAFNRFILKTILIYKAPVNLLIFSPTVGEASCLRTDMKSLAATQSTLSINLKATNHLYDLLIMLPCHSPA